MDDFEPFVAVVCWFGVPTTDDRVVLPGAITVPRYPVLLLHPNPSVRDYTPIGAIEMTHSTPEEFWVFGYADRSALPTDNENNPFYGLGMDLSAIEVRYDNGLCVFTHAELVGVTVVPEPAYPAAKIRFEEW